MSTSLFSQTVKLTGKEKVVKSALDALEGYGFLRVLKSCVEGIGFGDDCVGCLYPIEDDDDFEGVWCYYLDDEVIVSEDEFRGYLAEACERYIELHPDKKDELEQILSQQRGSIC